MNRPLDRKFFSPDDSAPASMDEALDAALSDLDKDDGSDIPENAETDDGDVDDDGEESEQEEKEEDSEDSDSEEDADVEDEDLVDILSPFNKKKFEKEFPEALKKFPQIERALNSVSKYKEVFPTLNDALEAQTAIERYTEIEEDLSKGSSLGFLSALREKDSNNFAKVVDNYLGNLKAVDESAFYHVISTNVKSMVVAMAKAGQESKNDDLVTAAKILNEFSFGTEKYEPPTPFAKSEDAGENKLKTDRENFEKTRLDTHQTELSERVENQIGKKIDQFIDTKKQMSPYVRRTAIREANELVAQYMGNDKEFIRILDKLWEKARKSDYSQETLGNIRRAYVSKATTYVPAAIKKVRAEALKSSGTVKKEDADRKGPIARGVNAAPKDKAAVNSGSSSGPKQFGRGKDPYIELLK